MDDTARSALRARIDAIDAQLLELIAERRRMGGQIAAVKVAEGRPVRDPEREAAVLGKARERAKALGLKPDVAENLMAILIDDALGAQRAKLDARAAEGGGATVVAYLGGPGAYSQLAALAHFGDRVGAVEELPCASFSQVVAAVEDRRALYGMLPIENTTTGSIGETYDLVLDSSLSIVGEHHLRVDHALIGSAKSLDEVETVFGHPQAIAQCRRFFMKRPKIAARFAGSTTRALEQAAELGASCAAVGGPEAAASYGLKILQKRIADYPRTYTRFIALARDATPPPKELSCKTSVVFSTADESGSLLAALQGFRTHRVNLTKLESRPIPGNPWEERFFVDFEGHVHADNVAAALETLREEARTLRVLGCYGADRLALAEAD